MPFFMACGLIGLWKTFKIFADQAMTLHEARLKNDGMHVEVSLLNWLGRPNKSGKFMLEIKDLAPPPLYPDSIPLKGDLFPHLVEGFEVKSEYPTWPWIKYYQVIRRKLFIHKDYTFMDREIMVAVMNGFYIRLPEF